MRILPIVALGVLWPADAASQRITVENGLVMYRASPSAAPRRLATYGHVREARLSPDGRMVAFIRGTPGDSVETALGREEATSLWIVRVDRGPPRMLVRGRGSDAPERALASFQSPWFSPDGGRIYFLSSAWVTSSAVHVVDVATGREHYLVPGNSLEVVPRGEYAGHLMVEQHRYRSGAGSYDSVWLFSPTGQEIRPIGETEQSIQAFRDRYVKPHR